MSKIDIVIGDDHDQENFRSVGKCIMRDKEVYNKVSYVITNDHIYYTKDTHDIFQRTIVTPINNHLKYVMHDIYCLYCRWKKMVL